MIVFAPRPATERWITEELAGEPYKVVCVPSVDMLVSRLSEWSDQIAIVDVDALANGDVAAIASIRDSVWRGELIAIGRMDYQTRSLLRVYEVLSRPLGSERLRHLLANLGSHPPVLSPDGVDTAETMPFR